MRVDQVHFSYGRISVLKGVTCNIKQGKITTLMGANGCGKSTLFSLITKNLHPDSGNIQLNGVEVQKIKQKEFAKQVAIVHQHNTVSEDISVERLISYGRIPHHCMMCKDMKEDEKYINWAIEVTQLEKYRNRPVSKLSGGQKQRVWIAMALAQNTKILFLDEPTTFLDIRYQIEILKLIKKLNKEFGITVVMVLHDINQAIHFSDEIIGLKDGVVEGQGAPNKIITPEFIKSLYGIQLEVTEYNHNKLVVAV